MADETGAGSDGAGPFSYAEPAGLLWGDEARAALAAGTGLSLAGGPGVFTLLRHAGRITPADSATASACLTQPLPDWAGLGPAPRIMGILNVTPDSFSGARTDAAAAIAQGMALLADGADIIDIGGESTRPGADTILEPTEQERVLPVIEALARAGAVISIDTRNAGTMERALGAGAAIVNDVSALAWDPRSAAVVARAGCPVVLMHMRGTPGTMASLTTYADLVPEVVAELAASVTRAEAAGIARHRIALDPGFGFAKTAEQDLALLRRLPALAALGLPLVVGLSRKRTVGAMTGEADPRRRDAGSMAAHLLCLGRGAHVIRAHDVGTTRQAVAVWRAVNRL